MTALDRRLTPARSDLAARHLEGMVSAARFVAGETREVIDAQAPVRREPSPEAPLDTQALLGERVTVYEVSEEGWAWGQLESDGYVGYLPASALGPPGPAPTHTVAALRTLMFPGPSIKLTPVSSPPLGAKLAIVRQQGRFAITATGGHLPANHLAPVGRVEADFVAVAERFLGVPYLWGGKTSEGIDCSGLVQVALTACGIACPRDSDMQESALGTAVAVDAALSSLERGDLVFWKGHVAIARDAATLVHANAHHMAVAIEETRAAIERIGAAGSQVIAVRRPR